MPQLRGTRVLSIIGEQGTGKTALAELLLQRVANGQHIEASDVVRGVHGDLPRNDMPFTNERTKTDPEWLGREIVAQLSERNVIITGVREKEVHTYLERKGCKLTVIAVWAPENERFARVKKQGKCKSYKEFQQHGSNEMSIGLRELLAYDARTAPPTFITSSFVALDEVADLVMDQLTRGWKVTKGQVL